MIIISDDGLQHFALKRDVEICLLDDTVKSENYSLLPAGPYRESLSRLKTIDLVVHHQREKKNLEQGRFNMTLQASSANCFEAHAFADHHHFNESDLIFDDEAPILMTEKDAVKCQSFRINDAWYLPVDAKLSDGFVEALLAKLAIVKK